MSADVIVPIVFGMRVRNEGPNPKSGVEASRPRFRDPEERAHPDWTHAACAGVIVSLHEDAALEDEKKLLTTPKKNEEIDVDDNVCQMRAPGKTAAVQEGKRKGRDGESHPLGTFGIFLEQQRVRVLSRSSLWACGVTCSIALLQSGVGASSSNTPRNRLSTLSPSGIVL